MAYEDLQVMAQNFVLGNGRIRLSYNGIGICDPLCVMDKNSLLGFVYQKGWANLSCAAAGADLILAEGQFFTLFTGGLGDTTVGTGWPATTKAVMVGSDTNVRAGGGLARNGYVRFVIGIEVGISAAAFLADGTSTLTARPFLRQDNGYQQPIAEAVLNNSFMELLTDDGISHTLGHLGDWPQSGGLRSGNRSVSNGGPNPPGFQFPLAIAYAGGDKNSDRKISLKVTFTRAYTVSNDATIPTEQGTVLMEVLIKLISFEACAPIAAACAIVSGVNAMAPAGAAY